MFSKVIGSISMTEIVSFIAKISESFCKSFKLNLKYCFDKFSKNFFLPCPDLLVLFQFLLITFNIEIIFAFHWQSEVSVYFSLSIFSVNS